MLQTFLSHLLGDAQWSREVMAGAVKTTTPIPKEGDDTVHIIPKDRDEGDNSV